MKVRSLDQFIVFENENYIIINKPYSVASLHERDVSRMSIQELAVAYHADAQLCHRLDKETSGALAIAKNPDAYRNTSGQFAKRKVDKKYHAFVEGIAEFKDTICNLPIATTASNHVRIDKQEGKESTTIFSTLETFDRHTLVACKPLTGRMHQIRVHLASLRFPIIADEQYGGHYLYLSQIKAKYKLGKYKVEQPLISRVALHAYQLSFKDINGEEVSATCPYPKDLRALKNQLEKNSKRR